MLSILKKELRIFFSTATGYIVISLFLLITGLFLWVIPGSFNIFDSGYANIDGLFYLAPWIFLFLCTAVSMRFFSEEKQADTWELLATKPLRIWQIILGKYFAGTILVFLSLLPTLLYYYTVIELAEPHGNVDSGQFWGSFIGLMFLSSAYMAVGTFASSISKNQIVAFIIGVTICFFLYYGFDLIGAMLKNASAIAVVENLGIHAHYKSMSRGVIDSRDVAYFLTEIFFFLSLTSWCIKKWK